MQVASVSTDSGQDEQYDRRTAQCGDDTGAQ